MPSNIYSKDYKIFLNRFKKARIEAGLTQQQVAKNLGKPQSYVSKSESGERRLDVTELSKFAELYKKSINYFLGSND